MLLEFKATNYKSFKEVLVLSLEVDERQQHFANSVLTENTGKNAYKGLCSTVIYGSNASGKTNIIGAMDTFKSIVLRGNVRNAMNKSNPNAAANTLELMPNSYNKKPEPVGFSIKFMESGILVEYSLAIDLGNFLEADYPRKVLSETLKINDHLIFERSDGLKFESFETIKDLLVNAFEKNKEAAISLSKSNLVDNELFLMNGFKAMFSSKLVDMIRSWLESKFVVIYRADTINPIQKYSDQKSKSIYIDKALNEVAGYFGFNLRKLGYLEDRDSNDAILFSFFNDNRTAITADVYESSKTIRFANMFPFVVDVIMNGGTLVVDDLDLAVPQIALTDIIGIFHNDKINIHHSQLIFSTSNHDFLNSNIFRKDEVYFVEYDNISQNSILRCYGSYGTPNRTRPDEYEKYILNNATGFYSGSSEWDFTPFFEKLLSDDE